MLKRLINISFSRKAAVIVLLVLVAISPVYPRSGNGRKCILKYNNDTLTTQLGVGLWGTAIPVDWNRDGNTDLLVVSVGRPYRGTYLYLNLSTNSKPLFSSPKMISEKALDCTHISLVGGNTYVFSKDIYIPDFVNQPFSSFDTLRYSGDVIGIDIKKLRSKVVSYVDWNNDGKLDMIEGIDSWDDYGWDNAFDSSGKWMNGPLRGWVYYIENTKRGYVNKGKVKAGGIDVETYGAPWPCSADFDGDGDQDLICGEFLDGFTYYENIGTVRKPIFSSGRRLVNIHGEIKMHVEMITPQAYDFDEDGFADLVVGDEDGSIALIRNTGKVLRGMPVFESPVYLMQQAEDVKFGSLSTPCCVDWDDDGNDDIITGNSAGEIAFIRNITGGANPAWEAPRLLTVNGIPVRIQAGMNGSIQGPAERKWGYTVPIVADWDGDGVKDIIVNSIFGQIMFYKHLKGTGTTELESPEPVLVNWSGETPKPKWNWWKPKKGTLVTQWRTTPYVIDWNNDGLEDLICLDADGYLSFFERFEDNSGRIPLKPGRRIFFCDNASGFDQKSIVTDSLPGLLQLNTESAGASGRRKFCFADYDGDGDLDLIVNSSSCAWFENIRTYEDGTTVLHYRGNISDEVLAGHTLCPTATDWDRDGYPDILAGAEDGHFYIFKNNVAH